MQHDFADYQTNTDFIWEKIFNDKGPRNPNFIEYFDDTTCKLYKT